MKKIDNLPAMYIVQYTRLTPSLAPNVAICHFLKPETNKGDFRLYFELVEKVVGVATTQKY